MAKAKYTRDKAGYFQTKVWDGTYVDGMKHRITLRTDKSSRELERMVNEHNEKLRNRQYVRPIDITLIEYARRWKTAYKGALALNTRTMYNNIIEKHLIKLNCLVGDLTAMHYVDLISATKGKRTQQQIAMTLRQIVRSAIKDKLLPADAFDEIFKDTIKVTYKAPEKRVLTEYEKEAVFKADFSPMDKAFVYILYGCGLRREEALALNVFNFNMARREIHIHDVIVFDGNKPLLKDTTKNEVNRTVPIPQSIFPFLESYVKELRGTTLLFHMQDGSYVTKSSYDKRWARIVRKMQAVSPEPIQGLTAHIFRHNYCASLCYQIPKISIRKIAELLGDSDKMVIEVYNHVIANKEKPHDVVSDALAL